MPLIPSPLERLLIFTLNQAPSSLMDMFGPAGLRVVLVAADVGIFDSLEDKSATLAELSEKTRTDEKGLRVLLEVLESFGYVQITRDRYANTRQTSKWLLSSSPGRVLDFLRWWHKLVYKFWDENLEAAVRQGGPKENLYEWISKQPNGWEVTQAGFEAAARLALDDVVKAVHLPESAHSLLDVGGGHGLYTIEICRRHPQLGATVFDLPGALQRARLNIEQENMTDRVGVKAGNYLSDDLGGPYSAALLFNVIHAHDEVENLRLLEHIGVHLEPGGRIFVMDQMAEARWGNVMQASQRILALAYHVAFQGQIFSEEQVSRWLREHGYGDVKKNSLLAAAGTVILSGSWMR